MMKSIFVPLTAAVGALLLAYAVREIIEARVTKASNACVNNLRLITSAKEQWCVERKKSSTAVPTWSDLQPYLGYGPKKELPHCPDGGVYTIGRLDQIPTCSIGGRDHVLPDTK
jgi:hypothetical protein